MSTSISTTGTIGLPAYGGSIRIVTLPLGYETASMVKKLVEDELWIGEVASVRIQGRKTPQGVQYSTAFVDFKRWNVSSPLLFKIEDSTYDDRDEPLLDLNQAKTVCFEDGSYKWSNGRTMDHLAIRPVEFGMGGAAQAPTIVHQSEPGEVVDEHAAMTWKSIYIPVIPQNLAIDQGDGTFHTVHPADIQSICENYFQVGKVNRVDFVSRPVLGSNQKPLQCAFVHFSEWYDNQYSVDIRTGLNNNDSIRMCGGVCMNLLRSVKFVTIQNGKVEPAYLVLKVNHKPISEASPDQNVHQLAEANKYLEGQMAEKDAVIESLRAQLAAKEAFDHSLLGEDGKGPMQLSELA